MFGVSFTEIVVVALVALLLFGPDELPRIAKTLGRFMGDFRRQSDSLRKEFYNSVYPPAQDFRRELENEARSLRSLKNEVLSGTDFTQSKYGHLLKENSCSGGTTAPLPEEGTTPTTTEVGQPQAQTTEPARIPPDQQKKEPESL